MATATKINGDNLLIYADGVAVGHSLDATLSVSQDLPDSTTKDSSQWVDHIHGNRSFEVSGSGLVVPASTMNATQVVDFILNANDVSIRFSNSVAGDVEWRGQVSVSSCSVNAPQNAPVGFDFTFTGNGALTKVTIT